MRSIERLCPRHMGCLVAKDSDHLACSRVQEVHTTEFNSLDSNYVFAGRGNDGALLCVS